MVCGSAWGVDTAAQRAFLGHQGALILVPAFPAGELLRQAYLRDAMARGNLLLVCDTWPDEPFSAPKALGRNHTIYALGHAALVVASRRERGGSWHGAADCLRGGYSPVYVWNGKNEDTAGNRGLIGLGAKPYAIAGRETLSEQLGLV